MNQSYTYIMSNQNNNILYVGVTTNLKYRIFQHKSKHKPNSFTAKYNLNKLVWFEIYNDIQSAIEREKQLKAGSRAQKLDLVNSININWRDLYDDL